MVWDGLLTNERRNNSMRGLVDLRFSRRSRFSRRRREERRCGGGSLAECGRAEADWAAAARRARILRGEELPTKHILKWENWLFDKFEVVAIFTTLIWRLNFEKLAQIYYSSLIILPCSDVHFSFIFFILLYVFLINGPWKLLHCP